MAEPYDYTFKGLQSPQEAFQQGLQTGNTIYEMQRQRALAQKQAAMEAEMQRDMAALSAKPTIGGIQQIMAKYPGFSEKFKPLLESMTETQKENRIRQANSIFMPLISGDKELALSQLDQQIEAATNSGDVASQKSLDALKKTLVSEKTGDLGDSMVKIAMGSFLAEAMGSKEFAKTYETIAEQQRKVAEAPAKLKEAEAKAEKAAVEAKFAESTAVADLEKKGWDIKKIQNDMDVAKQNAKIALMNAQIARESNVLKRDELKLKLDDHILKRDEMVRTKSAEAESGLSKLDNMLQTIDRAQKTPSSIVWKAAGPVVSRVTTVDSDVADFEELVNTMGSQAFLAQVSALKGMGALSDAEGKKLQAAFQNFSLRQSPKRLMENVAEAKAILEKSREAMKRRYGVPDTPVTTETPVVSGDRNVTVDY